MCFKKKKTLVNLGGIVESVVFLCILRNVILGAILSEPTRIPPEGIYRISDSCMS